MGLKDIAIVGNGGFAKEVEWLIDRINQRTNEWNILGFIDEKENKENRVIGDDSFVASVNNELHVTIAVGNGKIRSDIFNKYRKNENIQCPNFIDPSVLRPQEMHIGKGSIFVQAPYLQ